MDLESAKKIPLNRYTHSVRASQAVIQYGVGAIVDFPNQTLMTAAPEYWKEQVVKVHDERLEKLLHVDYFGVPGGHDESRYREGVSYSRFPEWYFCPRCRKFQPLHQWKKEYISKATQKALDADPHMVKNLRCQTCRNDLVVSRIVAVCEHGHIDDFPWIDWVHAKNSYGGAKPICDKPSLTFKTSASSTEGLEGLTVTCERCKARATLKGAFDKGVFEELDNKYGNLYNFRCTGRHPWKNYKEPCGKFPKILQRSSSSVFFPITANSLVIPPYSSILTTKIEKSAAFENQKNTIADLKRNPAMAPMINIFISSSLDQYANDIALEIGVPAQQIRPVLERKWIIGTTEETYSTASVKYRSEEYEALSGNISMNEDDYGDFMRESTNISDYKIPGIYRISLIHKIREVQALLGFSRIKPVEQLEDQNGVNRAVSIKEPETNWYPAYEVRGEGIFIEFDQEAIDDWLSNNPEIQNRADLLNENYSKTYFSASKPRKITGKFLLLHTISHLLIKQLSFECGYSIASLKERLYCSDKEDGFQMAGVLIYTASGDSEGTMGGLVRQGKSDIFPSIYKKAIEAAMTCSNDPVCSMSTGQGRDSLNLSACYSCTLIPETSCEEFNVFLDRGTVVGTYENRKMGFYYHQIYGQKPWEHITTVSNQSSPLIDSEKKMIILDYGIDLSDIEYENVWKSLAEWSENVDEKNILEKLCEKSYLLNGKEKPYQDSQFRVTNCSEPYKCDLMWVKSKVAIFTEDNEECYRMAKDTNWTCFLLSDRELQIDSLINAIKGE